MADLVQTAASVLSGAGAKKRTGLSGGTVTSGMAVYLDEADGKNKALDASNNGTPAAGIALTNSSNGQPITIQYQGDIILGATLVPGEVYCVSAGDTGRIAPVADLVASAGSIIHILGIARDDTTLAMNLFTVGVPYIEEGP